MTARTASRSQKAIVALVIGAMIYVTLIFTFAPRPAEAFPWGGATQQVIFCWNNVIWASVGPPRGGLYIWVPSVTRTYNYGPPRHSGQWLLGLAAPPYFCIVSPLPLIVFTGIIMTMLGSSR